jgi:hypothetical protein
VLQVASCGVAALRIDEDVSPEGIPDVLQDVGPDPPAVDPADVRTCDPAVSTGPLVFAGTCRVTVEAMSRSVRRLTLRNTGVAALEIRLSSPASAEQDLPVDAVENVDVPPDERADADLVCSLLPPSTCRVRIGG